MTSTAATPYPPPAPIRHLRERLPMVAGVILPLLILLLSISFIELSVRYENALQRNHQIQLLGSNLDDLGSGFEQDLNTSIYLTNGLQSYIQAKAGQLVDSELAPWLKNLQERGTHLRNIGLAPGNRIAYIYPVEGNEAALGLYYPDNKTQWPAVLKIIESRKPALDGPLILQQGGKGLIYREPVFLTDNRYWGIISTVIDADSLFATLAQKTNNLAIDIAITDTSNNTLIFGDPQVRTQAQSKLRLNIPGRSWEMSGYVEPINLSSTLLGLRISGWIFALIIAILLARFMRSLREKAQTLLALEESKNRFSRAFNTSPQGMALIDHRGNWIEINTSLTGMLGFSKEQFHHKQLIDLFADHQHAMINQVLHDINQHFSHYSPNSKQFEAQLKHAEGHLITGFISIAITHKKHAATQWIVQIIDISHRVLMENMLKEEAQYTQAILNNILDGIIIFDNKGHIKSCNPAINNMFSTDETRLLKGNIKSLFSDNTGEALLTAIQDHPTHTNLALSISQPYRTACKANGDSFPIDLDVTSLQRKHQTIYIGVFRDISERIRLDQLKNEFVSIVSHELRTPLTSIIGSLKLLVSGKLGQFDENATRIIDIACQNSEKLAHLINDLLDMDKLLAGKMELELDAHAAMIAINKAMATNQAYAEQHKVSFRFANPGQELYIKVDAMRLQQVLTNLLSNAAKFSPAGSEILIKLIPHGNLIRIEIIDHGAGIAVDMQHKLFKKFSQIDSSSTRHKGGTGLGLAISKELIERMGGNIGVNSSPGKGSCFYIELPRVSDHEQATLVKHNIA